MSTEQVLLARVMHPVQAAPRQSPWGGLPGRIPGMHPVQAAPRQSLPTGTTTSPRTMHPVQAAPRQRERPIMCVWSVADAPRAGSAEAKPCGSLPPCSPARDAPRAGSAEAKLSAARCRTARPDAPRAGSAEAKVFSARRAYGERGMHPVQAAPRQRWTICIIKAHKKRCTPCRQRRGKVRR